MKTSDVFDSYVEYCKEHDIAMVKRAKFYESLSNKKIFTKRIRGIDYYSIKIKNDAVEDDDDTEYGIDKVDKVEDKIVETVIVKTVIIDVIDAKELLIKQLQAKQLIDDIAFEKEDLEIKKIIKEQNLYKQIIKKVHFLPQKIDVLSYSDIDTDSDSDSDTDDDSEINEIGTEDYNFLIDF